jgi:hypothetical protein
VPQINNSPITCTDHRDFSSLNASNRALAVYLETIWHTIKRVDKRFNVVASLVEAPFCAFGSEAASVSVTCKALGWYDEYYHAGITTVCIFNPIMRNESVVD